MKKLFWLNIGLIGLLLIILPSFSPFIEIPYNSKRIIQVCFLIVVSIQLLFVNKYFDELNKEWNLITNKIKYLIYAVGSFGIISALFSAFPFFAFVEIGLYILLLVLIFSVSIWFKKYPDLFIKSVGVILSLMVVLYFIRFSTTYIYNFIYPSWPVWPNTQLVQILVNGEPFYPEPFLGFVHPRFLNHLQTWSLPLFVLFIINMPKKFWAYRGLLYFFTAFWWMLIFASDARGAMLASLLSLIVVVILFRTKIKEWIKTYLYTSLAGLLSYLFFFKLIIPDGSRTVLSRFGDSGRIRLWNNALDLFKDSPILGAGPMHFADLANGFGEAHPHNFYLQVLSEWGIISFTVLAALFIYLLFKWMNKSYGSNLVENDLNIQAALTASLLAGLLHSFVSGVLHTPLSQLMAAIVFGWAIGFYQTKFLDFKPKELSILKQTNMPKVIPKLVILFIALFLGFATIKTYKEMPDSRIKYIQKEESTKFSPRFWDHGNIGVD